MLTYLVASQLVGRARSGKSLQVEHLIESESLWLNANGGNSDMVERFRLVVESFRVAAGMLVFSVMKDLAFLTDLFTDGWPLDYRSPVVRGIFDVCTHHLLGLSNGWREIGHTCNPGTVAVSIDHLQPFVPAFERALIHRIRPHTDLGKQARFNPIILASPHRGARDPEWNAHQQLSSCWTM